jgi:hypothetical protein
MITQVFAASDARELLPDRERAAAHAQGPTRFFLMVDLKIGAPRLSLDTLGLTRIGTAKFSYKALQRDGARKAIADLG